MKERIFELLRSINPELSEKIKTKITNITGKATKGNVPDLLWQRRTPVSNRVLIPYKHIRDNEITLEQLNNSFQNGVVVDFVNEDYFVETSATALELKRLLGSNGNVSSIISIKSEGGASSTFQRELYDRLVDNFVVSYRGVDLSLTSESLGNYFLEREPGGSHIGNDDWRGFLYIDISGGQQNSIRSHVVRTPLFNPAHDYLTVEQRNQVELCLLYFLLHSVSIDELSPALLRTYRSLMLDIKCTLRNYNFDGYSLLDYCDNHPSLKYGRDFERDNRLYDPVYFERILLENFADDSGGPNSVHLSHNIAISLNQYLVDRDADLVFTPARPTNIFWSFKKANMLQQELDLDDTYERLRQIVIKIDEFFEVD